MIADLAIGREIEFTYKGITCFLGSPPEGGGKEFIMSNILVGKYEKSYVELLDNIKLDRKTIKELFETCPDDIEIITIY